MNDRQMSLLAACRADLGRCLKRLALADVAYKAIAFVVLTPLVGLLFRLFVRLSGRTVLADTDILYFVLSPVGVGALLVVGAMWIAIASLEQATLLTIAAGEPGRPVGIAGALIFAARQAWPVLQVAGRIVLAVLLAMLPFAAAAGATYFALLTRYDINYYLAEKPPEFLTAAAIGVVLGAGLAALLMRMAANWVFWLPLLLFEQIEPREALRVSRDRAAGNRTTIALWLAGWVLLCAVLSSAATGIAGWLGGMLIDATSGNLLFLAFTAGLVLVAISLVNLTVTLLAAAMFAVLKVNLYRRIGGGDLPLLHLDNSIQLPRAAFFQSMSRRAVFVLAGVSVIVAALVSVGLLGSVQLEDNTQIMAHRGASAFAPENTLAAVQRAIDDGADWVEVDVQESADGVVLVVHDSDLKKLGGSGAKIWEATADELRAVDIGGWFAPEFAGQRVPTLEEVLELCKGRIRVNIELKYYGHDQQLEQRVVDLIEAHDMQSQIVVMSLKHDGVRKLKQLRPDWRAGLLTAVAVGDLTRVDADFLAVKDSIATSDFVRAAHGRGKEVFVWTINDPVTMSNMIGRGVDAVITDDPAMGRRVLDEREKLSSLQRLLLEIAALMGAAPEMELEQDGAQSARPAAP